MIVGWSAGGVPTFQLVSRAGVPSSTPEALPNAPLSAASDMFAFANGDVGWAFVEGERVSVARLRDCSGAGGAGSLASP